MLHVQMTEAGHSHYYRAALGDGRVLTAEVSLSSQFVTVWLVKDGNDREHVNSKPIATLSRRRVLDRSGPEWVAHTPDGKHVYSGGFVKAALRAIARHETARMIARDASRAANAALWSAYRYGPNA